MKLGKTFFDGIRPLYGSLSQSQVDGLNRIAKAWSKFGDDDIRKLAYVFATAYHETAKTMQPVKEYGSTKYLRSKPYYPYYGRGDVQLTWEANYRDWSERLNVNLVANPDLALNPEHSAQIMIQGMLLGTFTGKALKDYINDDRCDFVNARRIVNGIDKAHTIARYAEEFLMSLQDNEKQPLPDVEPPVEPPKGTKKPWWAVVLEWLGW